MDKFVVIVKPKANYRDTRVAVRMYCDTHDKVKALSAKTNVSIVRLLDEMVSFCMDRLEILDEQVQCIPHYLKEGTQKCQG